MEPTTATPQAQLVLVVEDEALLRLQATDTLEAAGYEVLEAPNADAALKLLKNCAVGVLFTDIQMPGPMDGLALARLVHERWPDVRLVITSGRVRPTAEDMPDDSSFLSKPYASSSLLKTMEKASS